MGNAQYHPAINGNDLRQYDEEGVVCLRGLFGQNWIETLRNGVDRCMESPGPNAVIGDRTQPGFFFGDQDMWWREDLFRKFIFESPATTIAATVMRASRINFFFDQIIVKEPGTTQRTPWHQDLPYWAVRGSQICAIWLALDDVRAQNSLEYIAGSHRWNQEFSPHHFADGSLYADTGLPSLPNIDDNRGGYDIRAWNMAPGDCIVFDARIVHGAPGNSSLQQRRRAVSTRWCGEDARYYKRRGEIAVPSRDPGLEDGAELTCELFPQVWPQPSP